MWLEWLPDHQGESQADWVFLLLKKILCQKGALVADAGTAGTGTLEASRLIGKVG